MSNFSFLQTKPEYALFAPACVEAEKIYASAPAMCAVGCRKALELAVKWVYAADKTMKAPLQGESASPHSRANFPLCRRCRHLGQAALYRQVRQSGGTYRTQRAA